MPRQLLVGLLLFGVYLLVDLLNAVDRTARMAAARRHGRDLFDLERALHIDIEHGLNHWLAPHHLLSTLANYEYAWTYILSALALAGWVIMRRPDLWRLTRDSFVVLNLIAFATFALFPVTPPRMLRGLGFIDTVTRGGTVGSWGSGVVDMANQFAAMPSLHVGWALWVSVVLGRISARRSVQVVSGVHVALTVFVVMATANHYLLDAVAVIVPVLVGVKVAEWRCRSGDEVVAPCDAFFWHVEATGAAHHVGGAVVFAPTGNRRPDLAEIRELVRTELLPERRFHQRVVAPGRWRRLRWSDTEVDLDWHVIEREATYDGGDDPAAGLWALIGELAEEPMPRDRPLWRVVLVRGLAGGRRGFLILVHHTMADGIGTVTHALRLFRPPVAADVSDVAGPGCLQRAAGITLGLAQLATDGGARELPSGTPGREYAVAEPLLDDVRALAREYGVRVTDVVLALVGDAVAHIHPELGRAIKGDLRCSVTLLVRVPGQGPEGNATAAVMVDVPIGPGDFADRLATVSRRTAARLRRPTRAMASRFVMATGLRLLPEPCAGWFARTVYGGKFFHAVVSNMPGPTEHLSICGVPAQRVLPILPVAPGAPISLGALSWSGVLGFGIAADPGLVDAAALGRRIEERVAELVSGGGPGEGEEEASAVTR